MSFDHYGLFFGSEHALRQVLLPRVRSALGAGDHVVLAVDPARADAVATGLTGHERRGLHLLDRYEFYDAPGRMLAALHRMAVTHQPRRVTVIGEPVLPVDRRMEMREWQRLESVLDSALDSVNLGLVCLHDERGIPAGLRRRIRSAHPLLLGPGGSRANPDHRGSAAVEPAVPAPAPPADRLIHRLEIGSSLPRLREELTALGRSLGLAPTRVDDLVVAVNELAANVLEHGAGKGSVTLWRAPGRIVCDVFDEGGDFTDPLSGYQPADALRPRGYGLWITRQICDFLEISSDDEGSLFRMHFRIRAVSVVTPRAT